MVPTPLFYQLFVVALVLICLLIHVGLPDMPLPKPQPPLASNKHRRRRSQDPQPFTGLMHKPLCEACDREPMYAPRHPVSPLRSSLSPEDAWRTVDTQSHFCPEPNCPYHGWLGRGNLRANGHPGGQPWRQLQCVSC